MARNNVLLFSSVYGSSRKKNKCEYLKTEANLSKQNKLPLLCNITESIVYLEKVSCSLFLHLTVFLCLITKTFSGSFQNPLSQ